MSAEAGLITLLRAESSISALVGTKIYQMLIPQGTTLPAIVVYRLSATRELAHDGSLGLVEAHFRISLFSLTIPELRNIQAAVVNFLHGFRGIGGGVEFAYLQVEGEQDLFDPDAAFHVAVDVKAVYYT